MSGLELFQGAFTLFIMFIIFMLFFFLRKSNRLKAELEKERSNQKKLLDQMVTTTKTVKNSNEFLNQQFQQARSFVQETMESFEAIKSGMEFQKEVAPSLQGVTNSLYVKTEEMLKKELQGGVISISNMRKDAISETNEMNRMLEKLNQTNETKEEIDKLQTLHEEFRMKIALMKELSEQINLLVMNASIESSIGDKTLGIPMSLKEIELLSSLLHESVVNAEEELNEVQKVTSSIEESLSHEKNTIQMLHNTVQKTEKLLESGNEKEELLNKGLNQLEADLNEVMNKTEEITENVEKIERIVADQNEEKANIYNSIDNMHVVIKELFDVYKEMNSTISDFEYTINRFKQSS